jgi:hypothetical protein
VLRDGKEIYSGPADKIPDDVDGCDVVMAPDAYDSFRQFVARKQQQR